MCRNCYGLEHCAKRRQDSHGNIFIVLFIFIMSINIRTIFWFWFCLTMQHIFDFSAETHFVGDPKLVLVSGGDLRQVDLERFVAVYYPVATETNTTPLGSLMHMFITSILKECYPPAEHAEARVHVACVARVAKPVMRKGRRRVEPREGWRRRRRRGVVEESGLLG